MAAIKLLLVKFYHITEILNYIKTIVAINSVLELIFAMI